MAVYAGAPRSTIGFLPLIFPALAATATGVGAAAAVDEDFRGDLIAFGEDAFRITMQAIALAAPIIGFSPIVGQGVAAAMTFASSLALGVPIDDALLSTVANVVPGGLAAKAAVTGAVALTSAAVAGDPADVALLAAARETVKQAGGGDLAAGAFDAAVALARGQSLQDAGFAAMHRWVPGGGLVGQAAQFGMRMAEAAATGAPIERVIVDEARRGLALVPTDAIEQKIDEGIQAILGDPARFAEPFETLAASAGIPLEAARAAMMSVAEDEYGRLWVNPAVRLALQTRVDPKARYLAEAERSNAAIAAEYSKAAWWETPLERAEYDAGFSETIQEALSSPRREAVSSFDPYARPPTERASSPIVVEEETSAAPLVVGIVGAGALAALAIAWGSR